MGSALSSGHRLVFLLVTLATLAVLVAYWFSAPASILVGALFVVLLIVLRPLLLPAGWGATKVRMFSLSAAFGVVVSYGLWASFLNAVVSAWAHDPDMTSIAPWVAHLNVYEAPSTVALLFLLAVIWIVNRAMRDPTSEPIGKHFPDPSFEDELAAFCSALKQDLVSTDRQTNWSPQYYTRLDAEVEILAEVSSWERRRVVDLQKAIRADRVSKAFLVLGDPGSGKSVALRNLAHSMLAEVGGSRRVPIYVNLREWLQPSAVGGSVAMAWSEANPPTVAQLEAFVVSSIKTRGDVFTEEFVDRHFRDLWRNGYLFFIFDSFDEIPQLLDVGEESWLMDALSRTLSQFLTTHPKSRGLLASRVFRRPTREFAADKVLDIRPFSEERISRALTRFRKFTRELKAAMFRERPDLVSIARNPFLMTLLGVWVEEHGTLPDSQAKLYDIYLRGRLDRCDARLRLHGLSRDEVIDSAAAIAVFMFRSPEYGLEMPCRVLAEQSGVAKATVIMELLSFARIARLSGSEERKFTFVHRRFLEYLVTTQVVHNPELIPVEHIPTDSRGRDALALYAQICGEPQAREIAHRCWQEVLAHFGAEATRLRAIHCLRFLIDAFSSRRDIVGFLEERIAKFIWDHVDERRSMILAKISLEGVGLLYADIAEPILGRAITGQNSWLQETAFRACRQLPQISEKLQRALTGYVMEMPLRRFWATRRSLLFSLSLSDALTPVYRVARWRARSTALLLAVVPLTAIVAPLLFLIAAVVFVLGASLDRGLVALGHRRFMSRSGWARLAIVVVLIVAPLTVLVNAYPHLNFLYISESQSELDALIANWPFTSGSRSALVAAFLKLALGMIAIDWLGLWWSIRQRRHAIQRYLIEVLAGVAAMAVGLRMVSQLMYWLSERGWLLVFQTAVAITVVLALVYMSRKIVRQLPLWFKQRYALGQLKLEDRLNREEIATWFLSFAFEDVRLDFVRKLAERRAVVTGEWPSGFLLQVSASPSATELAKLEEQWLRLDR